MSINVNNRHGSSMVQTFFLCLPVPEVAADVASFSESMTTIQLEREVVSKPRIE